MIKKRKLIPRGPRAFVYSGDRASNGGRELSMALGTKKIIEGRALRPYDLLINWGYSQPLRLIRQPGRVLNPPEAIAKATNKLAAFQALEAGGVKTVEFTNEVEIAQGWSNEERTVVVRNKLTGHSGEGIVIIDPKQEVPNAPLYTKYVFKVKEFRVHVVDGFVIDTQQKIRDPERDPVTWKVRSHENGFIFARDNLVQNDWRDDLAVNAVRALGLDFGAVDIVEDKKGVFYVLEVNTAPGLEGQTIQSYKDAFNACAAHQG